MMPVIKLHLCRFSEKDFDAGVEGRGDISEQSPVNGSSAMAKIDAVFITNTLQYQFSIARLTSGRIPEFELKLLLLLLWLQLRGFGLEVAAVAEVAAASTVGNPVSGFSIGSKVSRLRARKKLFNLRVSAER